ncbi:hypothetical protein RND81_04G148000 [Saponaria officinalis]|uniref:Pollen Ole e 1 allergen and extensin family protein n=1 Tax=Saponaria officinalis TaxID=3572 RepID=A0AAW1LPR5_SAPOF
MAFPRFIIVFIIALTFSRIEHTLCSEVKGSVSCSDCGPDYDFTGIRILVKCSNVKKLSEAITDKKGNFATNLPSDAATSASPKCLAKVLGGSSQLYATKQNMVSVIVMARGDKNTYTLHTPLIVSKSCHGKCGSSRPDIDSSKTIDFPPEFGLPPASDFVAFIPIIGIP